MGKFLNTQYYDTVDSLVKMNEDLVQNPFYLYNVFSILKTIFTVTSSSCLPIIKLEELLLVTKLVRIFKLISPI